MIVTEEVLGIVGGKVVALYSWLEVSRTESSKVMEYTICISRILAKHPIALIKHYD